MRGTPKDPKIWVMGVVGGVDSCILHMRAHTPSGGVWVTSLEDAGVRVWCEESAALRSVCGGCGGWG